MTTLSLAKHSAKFHKFIRDEEINHIFQHSRILLREYTVPQATARLQQIKVSIRSNLLSKDRRALALDLTEIHSIGSRYLIIDYLLSQLCFSREESEGVRDELPLNCTLVDIILIFIRGDDMIVRQECAALLKISIEQIVIVKKLGKNEVLFISQVERILEQYPYDLLKKCQSKVVVYLFDSLQDIVLLEDYWYKNPCFCSQLNVAFEYVSSIINKDHSYNEQITESAISLALIFIFYTQKQGLNNRFQFFGLGATLKTFLLKKIANSDYSEIDFKRIKVLLLSKVEFGYEQFQIMQGLIEIEIKKKSFYYFETLNILTHYSHYALKLQSVNYLLRFLLDEQSIFEEPRVTQMIASLNYKNTLNYKEKQSSIYHEYLKLMIKYFDIDTIVPILQAANQLNPILTEQILSTLELILVDVASIDFPLANKWNRIIESEGRL